MGAIKTAWRYIRRSPFQSLAGILVMWMVFLQISVLAFLSLAAARVIHYFETRPEVIAFLKDKASEEEIEDLKKQLSQTGKTKEIRFISKEEAFRIYQEENKDNPLLLEMVTPDILPASLEIATHSPADLETIAQLLEQRKEVVEEVVFPKDVVENLLRLGRVLRNLGLALGGFLLLVSLVVIMVVLGMKITARREEIWILQILGASRFFIQKPFLIEGVFYGLVGSVLGWLIIFGIVWYWRSAIVSFFAPVPIFPGGIKEFLFILISELLAGFLLGVWGTILATWRYLNR